MPENLENSAVATGLEKGQFSFQSQRKANYHTIALISHASKVMLKILQARLQQYVNVHFQMFKLDLEKAEEPEIKWSTSVGSLKKQESSIKKTYFCFIDDAKAFDCVDHNRLVPNWERSTSGLYIFTLFI